MNFWYWLGSPSVFKNAMLVLCVFVVTDAVSWRAGRNAAAKSLGSLARVVPVMTERDKSTMALIHEQVLRNRRDGLAASKR